MATTPIDDRTKLPFSAAQDAAKQVLTLTTGIVAITVTFAKDLAKDAAASDQGWLLAAWVLFAIAALAGVLTLLAITGTLANLSAMPTGREIYGRNIRIVAAVQMLAFGIAMMLTVIYGWFAFTGSDLR